MQQDKDKRIYLIRNSTVEFLIFTGQSGEKSIEARYMDETIWLTQKLMAQLFDVKIPTINEHLKNIYDQDELERDATIRKFLTVQIEGDREILRDSGKVTAELAKTHAKSEFEKYRIVQDRLFESDFDRMIKQMGQGAKKG